MKYVLYARVSDKKQEDGTSPETQVEDLIAFAGKSKYALVVDTQKGGIPLARRKKLRQAIELLEKGDVLVVARADRLSRRMENLAVIKHLVREQGATVQSLDGSLKPASEDPMALAFEVMAGLFAQIEVMNLGKRMRRCTKHKREKGEAMGFCPYGFKRQGQMLVPDSKQQQTLQRMLSLRSEGKSYRNIVRILNDEGLYNTRGDPWNLAGVHSVINTALKDELKSLPDPS